MKINALSVLIATTLLVSACGYVGKNQPTKVTGAVDPSTQNTGDIDPNQNNNKPEVLQLNYANVAKLLLQPKCLSCHHHTDGFLSTPEGVRGKSQDILASVFIDKDMPRKPVAALTACELEMLRTLLDDGVPTESTKTLNDLTSCATPQDVQN